MAAIDKFKKIFDKLTEQRGDQWLERIPAWLGNHVGTVATGTAGMIYVRTVEGQVLIVFNNVAPSEYNILVTIGRSKDQPQLWQVISRREVWDVPASSSVVHHHQQHMFMAPDMVPIDRKQILALTVLVSDPANLIVRVYGSVVHTATGIRKIETEDIDLSSYVVTEGAKFVSIESDDNGDLSVHAGTAFDAPEIATDADIPVPDPGKYMIAFVLLYDGQTQLSNNDIRVPFPLGVIAKDSGLQVSEAAADTPADGDKIGFWDIIDNVLKSITWANIKATLKTYFDGIYSVLGHVHDAADVTYTPAVLADWNTSADPGDDNNALDQLAERVTDVEAAGALGFSDAEGDPAAVAVTAADGTSAYAARRDHVHAGDWILIEDKNLSAGDAASFDFQSIPATFRHLKIEFDGRSNRAGAGSDSAKIRFNNDVGNNYVGLIQWGAGQTEQATAGAPTTFTFVTAETSPANWFNNSEILIMDYANTNKYHSWQARGMQTITNSAGGYFIYDAQGLYLSTTAISRVTLYPDLGTNFKQYSRATLYGMK